MILIKKSELENYKCRDNILCKCEYCHNTFYIKKNKALCSFKSHSNIGRFCCRKCADTRKRIRLKLTCKNCQKDYERNPCQYKGKNTFCSSSCAATYNNTHKTTGYRRSKLEIWIEKELIKLYPTLEIHYNKIDAINAELDIYIPSLKLAFELNGIFHYEPVYSENKLKSTQNNDQRKFQVCAERGIGLCVIDTSSQKYFKENTGKKFLNIITKTINKKMRSYGESNPDLRLERPSN